MAQSIEGTCGGCGRTKSLQIKYREEYGKKTALCPNCGFHNSLKRIGGIVVGTKLIELEAPRTYASKENAVKAVEKKYGDWPVELRYIVYRNEEGRYFPVFIGYEAIREGVHFHFNVLG